jgi:hypothetical protein
MHLLKIIEQFIVSYNFCTFSPPTNAEVKKMWVYTFTPPYVFMA